MRLLHTSDWHLGRSFHREGMLEHQAAFVDHLLEVIEAEAIDLVVVAGDVYDRALPPVDAVRLADDALVRLVLSTRCCAAVPAAGATGRRSPPTMLSSPAPPRTHIPANTASMAAVSLYLVSSPCTWA